MTKKETIIDAFNKLGLNQTEFGKLFYVKQPEVSRWLAGKREPSMLVIEKVRKLVKAKEEEEK